MLKNIFSLVILLTCAQLCAMGPVVSGLEAKVTSVRTCETKGWGVVQGEGAARLLLRGTTKVLYGAGEVFCTMFGIDRIYYHWKRDAEIVQAERLKKNE